jgi:uroporphyrinogen decarboxylase
MNARQRVIAAIERTTPDRVPITRSALPGALLRHGEPLRALLARYPSDVYAAQLQDAGASDGEFGQRIGMPSRDAWGALWLRPSDEHKGQVVFSPLKDWDALPGYVPPDIASDAAIRAIAQQIAASDGQRYVLTDGGTLWQRMFYLHGYQETLEDLALRPDRCVTLRDLILEVMVRRVERLVAIRELDGVHFRDDWGTQTALMISPQLWRAFFKPAYARLLAVVRNAGKHVWFHSDGAIADIIPDLIELGVQVLNPQVPLIGRERLAALSAGRVCVQDDIDRQGLLPFGTPEAVRAAVRANIDAFGRPSGGYVGNGEVASDVPLANAEAMLDEMTRYGVYRR